MESVSVLSSFLSMIFALAVILGLLLGVVHFLKKFLPGAAPGLADNAIIHVVASRYLGPKSSIMIVEILGKVLVIGAASDKLSCLAEISGEDALEKIRNINQQNKPLPSLSDYMKKNTLWNKLADLWGDRNGKKQ